MIKRGYIFSYFDRMEFIETLKIFFIVGFVIAWGLLTPIVYVALSDNTPKIIIACTISFTVVAVIAFFLL